MTRKHPSHRTGLEGEEIAAEHLRAKGYAILHRRFRYRNGELDIVARHGRMIVFAEVKTINLKKNPDKPFGDPETWLTEKKKQSLYHCAEYYLGKHGFHDIDCRFDLITVRLFADHPEVNHIENAFWF